MKEKKIIRAFVLKNSFLLIMMMALSFVLSELVVKGSTLISNAVNTMQMGIHTSGAQLSLNMGKIIIVAMGAAFLNCICKELFSIKIQKACKETVMEAIEKAEYSFFENSSGTVVNKLTSDISDMSRLFSEILPEIVQYAITIVTIGMAMIKMNWKIFGGIMLVFPMSLFFCHKIAEQLQTLAKIRRDKYDELSNIALDNVRGIDIAKSYGIEKYLGDRIKTKADEILKNEYTRNRYQAIANGLTLLIKWIPTVICSLITLHLVLRNMINVGDFMAFLILFGKISTPLSELPFRFIEGKEVMVSVKRMQELMNVPSEESGDYLGRNLESQEIVIDMENVSFSYDDEVTILKNLSMKIMQGEKIAIVGISGAGKSTLLKLMCGFIQNTMGYYKLYGHEFKEWNIDAARRRIAYVPQESYLFPGTILENVAYGNNKVENRKVEYACKKAGIYEKIMELPEEFNTEVGERGVNLSGGERQRLSIARALYKDAPIILLDEPTSALDEETQAYVNNMIYGDKEKTVIVIAHRLSTIKEVDKIYCMEGGRFAEYGTHEELMRKNGVYAALYNKEAYK